MPRSTATTLRLLYLTAVDVPSGSNIVASASRVAIGLLSRDFTVSLAVAGPITTVGLNRLRVDLGPVRVAGGFEPSSADRRSPSGLRGYLQQRTGTDMINARLQTAIQHKVDDVDAVVVDDAAAWFYRPVGSCAPVCFMARDVLSIDEPARRGFWASLRGPSLRESELAIYQDVDHLFARPKVANALSDIGVPMRLLQDSFSRPGSGRPSFDDAVFSLTGERIGYTGYLGFDRNIASLMWFLDGVWPLLQRVRPGIEFHVVGSAPDETLQQQLNARDGVYLHWGSTDRKLLDLGCRVVVDPLLYENHVDAKLVNAMARSLPVVTTVSALGRAHSDLSAGVVAAGSQENMATAVERLMSDSNHWKAVTARGRKLAQHLLPDYEVAHAVRRVLLKVAEGAGSGV